jgi:hypothetical protein
VAPAAGQNFSQNARAPLPETLPPLRAVLALVSYPPDDGIPSALRALAVQQFATSEAPCKRVGGYSHVTDTTKRVLQYSSVITLNLEPLRTKHRLPDQPQLYASAVLHNFFIAERDLVNGSIRGQG